MECVAQKCPPYKWNFPTRLEYEYPEMKLDIGQGFHHPENEHVDPWMEEKYNREGMDIPKRIFPKKGNKKEA